MAQRNRHSRAFGCCDRQYWGWKQRDFSDLTKQYALYPFGKLIGSDPDERDLFRGMVRFLLRNLQPDGSADQCFPQEASSGPTLYAMHALLSSYALMQDCFDKAEMEGIQAAIARSLDFALAHPEVYGEIANHRALYAHTFLLGHIQLGHQKYLEAYQNELHAVAALYQEGWFREYFTADPGYQTQCLHYLTLCWKDKPDENLKKTILESIEDFLAYFVFPDGSFGGLFAGRATECVYPYPLFFWSQECPAAREMATCVFVNKEGAALPRWDALDDDNCIRIGANFLLASEIIPDWQPAGSFSLLPWKKTMRRSWPQAGLVAISGPAGHMVINAKRGGIFKLVSSDGAQILEDTGYLLKTGWRRLVSSHYDPDTDIHVSDVAGAIRIEKTFTDWQESFMNSFRLVILRLLSGTLLKFKPFSRWLKKRMVAVLMRPGAGGKFRLRREINVEKERIVIRDEINASPSASFSCSLTSGLVPFHMASAGYYRSTPALLKGYAFEDVTARSCLAITTGLVCGDGKIQVQQERALPGQKGKS